MNKAIPFVITLLLLQFCSEDNTSDFAQVQLKCNNQKNPAGTGKNPVFSWIIPPGTGITGQSAYQLVLGSE